jgi:hypothetical protein
VDSHALGHRRRAPYQHSGGMYLHLHSELWTGGKHCTLKRDLRLQEVEMRPQQLAVVVDRSFSTVQDLIDNTACMVWIVYRSC